MKKELKSGILSADCRPTVGGANEIAVLAIKSLFYLQYVSILKTGIKLFDSRLYYSPNAQF